MEIKIPINFGVAEASKGCSEIRDIVTNRYRYAPEIKSLDEDNYENDIDNTEDYKDSIEFCYGCTSDCYSVDGCTNPSNFRPCPRSKMIYRVGAHVKQFDPSETEISLETSETEEICKVAKYIHGIGLYEICMLDKSFSLCTTCNGSGTIIGKNINACPSCKGTGLIYRKNNDELLAYYKHGKIEVAQDPDASVEEVFNIDRVALRSPFRVMNSTEIKSASLLNNIKSPLSYEKPFYINKKYLTKRGTRYEYDPEKVFVLYDAENSVVAYMGEMHNIYTKYGIPYYIDIEFVTNNRFKMIPKDEFFKKNTVADKLKYEGLLFINLQYQVDYYVPYATYDSTNSLSHFYSKYPSVEDIEECIHDSVRKAIIDVNNRPDIEDSNYFIDKCIDDAKRLNIKLSDDDVIYILIILIMSLNSNMSNENFAYQKLTENNIIAVYIVEHLCITMSMIDLD